ncbi:chromatin modification-related protein EAF7-like isoform X2 [Hyalella azteca]|uniref:Chromatin modification-related protein EAF7-like isoform X2 n=1 Tax=Hyalella azteca TaxID=294128 RepID=A0A8B7P3U1_HYAAZ|nr:chromatin modification-related protein EAF7-like isoform X2 [Hyalella azteca]
MMIEWTVNNEIQLFHAMTGHKPIGINKHFQMLMIHSKLSESLHTEVSSQIIWDKLRTLYDLSALEDSDKLQFPITDGSEFTLPSDYLQNVNVPSDLLASDTRLVDTSTPQLQSLPLNDASSTLKESRLTPSVSLPTAQPPANTIGASSKGTPASSSSALAVITSRNQSLSSSRHQSPCSSRLTAAVSSPGRLVNGKESELLTPKQRAYNRVSNERSSTPSSLGRRSGASRQTSDETADETTPRRPKRGRDSKSGSPVASSAPHSKRRKV